MLFQVGLLLLLPALAWVEICEYLDAHAAGLRAFGAWGLEYIKLINVSA